MGNCQNTKLLSIVWNIQHVLFTYPQNNTKLKGGLMFSFAVEDNTFLWSFGRRAASIFRVTKFDASRFFSNTLKERERVNLDCLKKRTLNGVINKTTITSSSRV
jgi:hypothetical protein